MRPLAFFAPAAAVIALASAAQAQAPIQAPNVTVTVGAKLQEQVEDCLLYTSPSPRDS